MAFRIGTEASSPVLFFYLFIDQTSHLRTKKSRRNENQCSFCVRLSSVTQRLKFPRRDSWKHTLFSSLVSSLCQALRPQSYYTFICTLIPLWIPLNSERLNLGSAPELGKTFLTIRIIGQLYKFTPGEDAWFPFITKLLDVGGTSASDELQERTGNASEGSTFLKVAGLRHNWSHSREGQKRFHIRQM